MSLSILSSIHVAIIVALFWILLANAIVATQLVEYGPSAFLLPVLIYSSEMVHQQHWFQWYSSVSSSSDLLYTSL
jgi:hypothetical protein